MMFKKIDVTLFISMYIAKPVENEYLHNHVFVTHGEHI